MNKVNTKATLRWNVLGSPELPAAVRERFVARFARRITQEGDLVMSSQRFRDQGRNVADCLEKLRTMLAEVAIAPRKRKPTKPTRGSRERRLKDKRARSMQKQQRRSPRLGDDR